MHSRMKKVISNLNTCRERRQWPKRRFRARCLELHLGHWGAEWKRRKRRSGHCLLQHRKHGIYQPSSLTGLLDFNQLLIFKPIDLIIKTMLILCQWEFYESWSTDSSTSVTSCKVCMIITPEKRVGLEQQCRVWPHKLAALPMTIGTSTGERSLKLADRPSGVRIWF